MLDKLNRRALQVGLAALISLWTINFSKPVSAQVERQSFVASASAAISNRPIRRRESNGTVVILPGSYNPENTYPALVLLPWTGGRSVAIFDGYLAAHYEARTTNPFIVILPNVSSSSAAYSRSGAWNATIGRYENLVRNDLNNLTAKYSIDESRIALAGPSLGGDLSWALSLRNPDLFRGAIVIGSQSGYRDAARMSQLAANDSRFFMIIGQQDIRRRVSGMRNAVQQLANYGVDHRFEVVPNTNHRNIINRYAPGAFTQSIDYVLFDE